MKGIIIYLAGILLFMRTTSNAQLAENWQNTSFTSSGAYGMETERAYDELLQGKKSVTVTVAVIDGGTDINHPDLRSKIWTNKGEIAGNNKDDDSNGYIDDVHGWNYLGDVQYGNLEITRILRDYRKKYSGITAEQIARSEKKEYENYLKLEAIFESQASKYNSGFLKYNNLKRAIEEIESSTNDSIISSDYISELKMKDERLEPARTDLISRMSNGKTWSQISASVTKSYDYYLSRSKYHYNIAYDPRSELYDDPNDLTQLGYGNNDVKGPEASHGTHVAGIIGAARNNDQGINGVADNIELMILRAVPDGDENDKDVANAIFYAVNNGAKVINMSFGKDYSPHKSRVDEAVKFAESKDVLIVHGSGNDKKNTDKERRYPNKFYTDSKIFATNWIEVGAISPTGDAADFSNYGQKGVDIFAPGVKINSTMPEGKYEALNGTSMASPAVAGVAAVIRSYYPKLTAQQVKDAIVRSTITPKQVTKQPGTKKSVKFKKLCSTGGMVNAYNALIIAGQLANQ